MYKTYAATDFDFNPALFCIKKRLPMEHDVYPSVLHRGESGMLLSIFHSPARLHLKAISFHVDF